MPWRRSTDCPSSRQRRRPNRRIGSRAASCASRRLSVNRPALHCRLRFDGGQTRSGLLSDSLRTEPRLGVTSVQRWSSLSPVSFSEIPVDPLPLPSTYATNPKGHSSTKSSANGSSPSLLAHGIGMHRSRSSSNSKFAPTSNAAYWLIDSCASIATRVDTIGSSPSLASGVYFVRLVGGGEWRTLPPRLSSGFWRARRVASPASRASRSRSGCGRIGFRRSAPHGACGGVIALCLLCRGYRTYPSASSSSGGSFRRAPRSGCPLRSAIRRCAAR